MEQEIVEELEELEACNDGLEWVGEQTFTSYNDLWQVCPRADWMLWLIEEKELKIDKKVLVRVACELVKTFWDELSWEQKAVLERVDAWLDGKITPEQIGAPERVTYAVRALPQAINCLVYAAITDSPSGTRACAGNLEEYAEDGHVRRADIVREYIPEVSC